MPKLVFCFMQLRCDIRVNGEALNCILPKPLFARLFKTGQLHKLRLAVGRNPILNDLVVSATAVINRGHTVSDGFH